MRETGHYDVAPGGVTSVFRPVGERIEGQREGAYRLGPVVARGRRGAVIEVVRDPGTRTSALWLVPFDPSMSRSAAELRFLCAAAHHVGLRHPNVLRVLDYGSTGDHGFLITEPVPGETLAELLDTQGPLAWRDAALLGLGIAEALARLHASGLAHGALSPRTVGITVDDWGQVCPVLVDGVVGEASEPTRAADWTALGQLLQHVLSDTASAPRRVTPLALEDLARRLIRGEAAADEAVARLRDWLTATDDADGRSRRSFATPTLSTAPVRETSSDWWWVFGSVAVVMVSLLAVGIGAVGIVQSLWWSHPVGSLVGEGVVRFAEPVIERPADVVVDGVGLTIAEAARTLAFVNEASAEALREADIHPRGIQQILEHRPFGTVEAFAATRGIGRQTITSAARAARP